MCTALILLNPPKVVEGGMPLSVLIVVISIFLSLFWLFLIRPNKELLLSIYREIKEWVSLYFGQLGIGLMIITTIVVIIIL